MKTKKAIACMALAVVLALSGASFAVLLGVTLEFPLIAFDNQGTTNYEATTDLLSISASPIAIRLSASDPPILITPIPEVGELLAINAEVDSTGALVGGVPGDDLVVAGEVDLGVIGFFSGILLTGEVTAFGYQDSGGTTDLYDFRFMPTGGQLAFLYGDPGIGVRITSEGSTFVGDFNVDFGGGAKGSLGQLSGGPPQECELAVSKSCLVPPVEIEDGECKGDMTEIVLQYTGESCAATTNDQDGQAKCVGDPGGAEPVRVVPTKDAHKIIVSPGGQSINVGDLVSITSTKGIKGKLSASTEFDVRQDGAVLQSLVIHTSCSQPIDVGDQFGSMLLVQFTSREGGTITLDGSEEPAEPTSECTIMSDPPGTPCRGKLKELSFRYLGGNCSQTTNDQLGNLLCAGDADLVEPVRILVKDRQDGSQVFLDTGYPATVGLGDVVVAAASNAVKPQIRDRTSAEVFSGGGVLLQTLTIRTSCSHPLALGDRFGSMHLVGFVTDDGGPVSLGAMVNYGYTIENTGTEDVFFVTAEDDLLGPLPGSPIPSLAQGESVMLTASAFVTSDTVNTVTVTGETEEEETCEAQASATVSLAPFDDKACRADGSLTGLVFEYTGDSCAATTNYQNGKFSCSGDPAGAAPVRLVVTEDGGKFTVSPGSQSLNLGDQVTIQRKGGKSLSSMSAFDIRQDSATLQSLRMSTSCSQPLAAGDQFGSLRLVELLVSPP